MLVILVFSLKFNVSNLEVISISEGYTNSAAADGVGALKSDTKSEIVKSVISNFEAELEAETEGMKSIAQAILSDAFDPVKVVTRGEFTKYLVNLMLLACLL